MDFLQWYCFAKQNLMRLLQPRESAAGWKVDWGEKAYIHCDFPGDQ